MRKVSLRSDEWGEWEWMAPPCTHPDLALWTIRTSVSPITFEGFAEETMNRWRCEECLQWITFPNLNE